jgi:hypothetical protein
MQPILNFLLGNWSRFDGPGKITAKPKTDNAVDTVAMNKSRIGKSVQDRVEILPTGEGEVDGILIVSNSLFIEYLQYALFQKKIWGGLMAVGVIGSVVAIRFCSRSWVIGAVVATFFAGARSMAAASHLNSAKNRLEASYYQVVKGRSVCYATNTVSDENKSYVCPSEQAAITEQHVPIMQKWKAWIKPFLDRDYRSYSKTPADRDKWVKEFLFDQPMPRPTYRDSEEDQKAFAQILKEYDDFKKFVIEQKEGLQNYRNLLPSLRHELFVEMCDLVRVPRLDDYAGITTIRSHYFDVHKDDVNKEVKFEKFMFTVFDSVCPPYLEVYYKKLYHDLKNSSEEYSIYYYYIYKLFLNRFDGDTTPLNVGTKALEFSEILRMPKLPQRTDDPSQGILIGRRTFCFTCGYLADHFVGDEKQGWNEFAQNMNEALARNI